MSCGFTCIATSVGGIPEWIQDGKNGFLIPVHSAQLLGEKIEQIIDDPELRLRIGERARETVQKVADWDLIMNGVAVDYDHLIQ